MRKEQRNGRMVHVDRVAGRGGDNSNTGGDASAGAVAGKGKGKAGGVHEQHETDISGCNDVQQ